MWCIFKLGDLMGRVTMPTSTEPSSMRCRILWLKFGKNIGEQVEASGFVGAEDDGALNDVAAVGDDLNGFVAHAKEFFGVLEKNLAGGSELDGLGGAVEEPCFVGLFELANLGANG